MSLGIVEIDEWFNGQRREPQDEEENQSKKRSACQLCGWPDGQCQQKTNHAFHLLNYGHVSCWSDHE